MNVLELPYIWAWQVNSGDGQNWKNRHDRVNDLFHYDYDQARQFETMYKKHQKDRSKRGDHDGAAIATLNGDVNKVSNGVIYTGYCLSDVDAGTSELIVTGKDTRYRQKNTNSKFTRHVWRFDKSV